MDPQYRDWMIHYTHSVYIPHTLPLVITFDVTQSRGRLWLSLGKLQNRIENRCSDLICLNALYFMYIYFQNIMQQINAALQPLITYIGGIVTYVSAWILLHHQTHWLCRHLYPTPLGDLEYVSGQNLNSSISMKRNIQKIIHVEAKSKIFLTIYLCQKEY